MPHAGDEASENLESWLAWREAAERPGPGSVEDELRGYLECGILCFGFARARCTGCGQGFVVAFSCKGRGVCPSCNGRHMAQTAAHLADHVIPPVPVRQRVISVPKRLRGMLADRPAAVSALTKIFIAEIERLLCSAAGVTRNANTPTAARPRLGAVSFLHRFGSALNHHVHVHACVTDGVFMPPADGARCDTPPAFVPARPINQGDLTTLTERVRRRVIRWFRLKGLLAAAAAADMLAWENSGFSVDASVRITLIDRDVPSYFQSLEHLLRYCARPPLTLERLSVTRDAFLRITRVRYVLPVTALAIGNIGKQREALTGGHGGGGHATGGCCAAHHKPPSHDTSRIAWARLITRVVEEFPLECPNCGGDIRLREDGRQEPAHFEPEVRTMGCYVTIS